MEEKIKKPWYKTKKGKFRCIEKGAMNPDGTIYTFRREYEGEDQMENAYAAFKRKDRINKAVFTLKEQGYYGVTFSNIRQHFNFSSIPDDRRKGILKTVDYLASIFGKNYPLSALFVNEEREMIRAALKIKFKKCFKFNAGAINYIINHAKMFECLPSFFPRISYGPLPTTKKRNKILPEDLLKLKNDRITFLNHLNNLCVQANSYSEFIVPAAVRLYIEFPSLTKTDIELALVSDLNTSFLSKTNFILSRPATFHRFTSKTIKITKEHWLFQKLINGKAADAFLFSTDEKGRNKLKAFKIKAWFCRIRPIFFPASLYRLSDLKLKEEEL